MVVCKFFQQGYCRYGKNCKFEHIYGSKYSYHAPTHVPPPQQPAVPQSSAVTDEQLLRQVQSDVVAALRGGQWILSCYSPFKENPIFPGIPDLSPEEARLFIYEAKATNNIEQAVTYMNNLLKETKQKYEQLVQPDANIMRVLRSLYKGEVVASPFSAMPQNEVSSTNNAAASVFRSAVQTSPVNQNINPAQSLFQQGNSIFNPQPQPTDPAKQLFAQAKNNQNVFGPSQSPGNIFGQQMQSTAKSVFASAVQQTFPTANPNVPIEPVSQGNIFQTANNPQSVFGQLNQVVNNPQSVFGQARQPEQSIGDPGIYSKMEELSDIDLEAFKSDSFQLGFIPELPPPRELCAKTQLF